MAVSPNLNDFLLRASDAVLIGLLDTQIIHSNWVLAAREGFDGDRGQTEDAARRMGNTLN